MPLSRKSARVLREPIVLAAKNERDCLIEMHHAFKERARLLLEKYEIEYLPNIAPEHMAWWLVLALARDAHPGFNATDEPAELMAKYRRHVVFTGF